MDFATVAKRLIEVVEDLKIAYFVGGSLASGARGIPRSTLDTDLIIEMTPQRAALLASELGPDWYLDVEMARSALVHHRAFNVIHMLSSYRFDLFPAYTDFHASEMKRSTREPLHFPGGEVDCMVASAEDTILSKLRWYRDGGEISERQWSDVMGVFAVNPVLDFEYLKRWAGKLAVADLLERAQSESQTLL